MADHLRRCAAALCLAAAAGCDAGPGADSPAAPRVVTAVSATPDAGTFTHDVVLRNGRAFALGDVDVVLTLSRTDGGRPETRHFWGHWGPGEAKRVSVRAHDYQKAVLSGTALGPPKSVRETVAVKAQANWARPKG